jgi:hypothetical protein
MGLSYTNSINSFSTMKGIVFTKFIEMMESTWSVDLAEQIIGESNLPSGGVYTAVGTYPHTEMVAMVMKLSEHTGMSPPELLRAFGRFLFGQFTKLYPAFFVGKTSSIDFVASIESVIHVEVRKLYPDADLPRFEVKEHRPDFLEIVYRSDRHLGDLALGLMESCVVHFGEDGEVRVEKEPLQEPGDPVCFRMTRQS